MRRRALSAVATAGLAALALSACTVDPTTQADPTSDESTTQTDPAPTVTVVNESLKDDAAAAGQDSAVEGAVDESDETTSPTDAATDATDPADSVTIAAGEELVLAVEGGEFAEVRLTDADHATVPVDTGTFDPDNDDDSDEADDEATSEAASEGTSEQAMAGGTTEPSHGLMDVEDAEDEDAGAATDPQGPKWKSSTALVTGATYAWEATTVAPDGDEHTATGTVTTPVTTAQEELTANTAIADDQTVGVGAPVAVAFNSTIPEDARAAIEARLSVTVTDADGEPVDVEGSWGWLYDTADGISRVHYRPEEFWPADVSVDVSLPLEGVEYSPRWYGKEDVELSFDVGRDQRVVADAQSHRMTIERDGEQIADWPTSLGSAQAPSYNGTHVVMAKHEFYTMTSERWDYETDVSWAVRIHNNGEFIHAAPWSVGVQGSANVSHGCINLSTERAKEYYDMALYGDPVEITGSSVDLNTEHSDISDWVYSWEDWQELSALD